MIAVILACSQHQKDQTSELDEDGQANGQLREQQLPATQEQLGGGIAPARQGLEEIGDRPGQREGGGGDVAPDQCVERDWPGTLDDEPAEQDRPEQMLIESLVGELNDQGTGSASAEPRTASQDRTPTAAGR
jgi:hypothetical protein